MIALPRWAERAACLEIYGILQHIANRPLSMGHDGAVREARAQLKLGRDLLRSGRPYLLNDSQINLLSALLEQSDNIPIEVLARTLIGPIAEVLAQPGERTSVFPRCYVAEPPAVEFLQLVVAVGPTIGIGDEILAARALIERAKVIGNLTLHVSSHHYDVWGCMGGPIRRLPPPPHGAFIFLEALSLEQRERTAYQFMDFLVTDPAPEAYVGPAGIVYGGRWSMGARECDFVNFAQGLRYQSRYPDGLPACRLLETRWMAGRALPHPRRQAEEALTNEAPLLRRGQRVLLQPLTAKPGLTFPVRFYRDVLSQVADSIPTLEVQIVPGPTQKSQTFVDELLNTLVSIVSTLGVESPNATSLGDVFERLKRADVLFGPDTFTSHFAALLDLPQVTISLPEHRSWRTIESPCLSVIAGRPMNELIEPCARALIAFLRMAKNRDDSSFAGQRLEWRESMCLLAAIVREYLQIGRFDRAAEAGEAANKVQQLLHMNDSPLEPLDLSQFHHPDDGARALARWYHDVSLSEMAAFMAVN